MAERSETYEVSRQPLGTSLLHEFCCIHKWLLSYSRATIRGVKHKHGRSPSEVQESAQGITRGAAAITASSTSSRLLSLFMYGTPRITSASLRRTTMLRLVNSFARLRRDRHTSEPLRRPRWRPHRSPSSARSSRTASVQHDVADLALACANYRSGSHLRFAVVPMEPDSILSGLLQLDRFLLMAMFLGVVHAIGLMAIETVFIAEYNWPQ
jgi:hypothetical protein